jgi:hypothetical protein
VTLPHPPKNFPNSLVPFDDYSRDFEQLELPVVKCDGTGTRKRDISFATSTDRYGSSYVLYAQ